MEKRGQYFTIDAFVGLLVLSTSVIVMLGYYQQTPAPEQSQIFSQNFISTLEQTRIRDINNPYVKQLIIRDAITNTENTIFQQTLIYNKENPEGGPYRYTVAVGDKESDLDSYFLSNLSDNIISPQFNYEIRIDGDFIVGRGEGQATAKVLISNKRVVFAQVDETGELLGPVIAEVRVWR